MAAQVILPFPDSLLDLIVSQPCLHEDSYKERLKGIDAFLAKAVWAMVAEMAWMQIKNRKSFLHSLIKPEGDIIKETPDTGEVVIISAEVTIEIQKQEIINAKKETESYKIKAEVAQGELSALREKFNDDLSKTVTALVDKRLQQKRLNQKSEVLSPASPTTLIADMGVFARPRSNSTIDTIEPGARTLNYEEKKC